MIGQVNESDKKLQIFHDGAVFEFDEFEVLAFQTTVPQGILPWISHPVSNLKFVKILN
jgi:hypothetical protein